MDSGTLYKAIGEVCPVLSTRVEVSDDRATWSFVPDPAATQPQIDAGNNVIQTIPLTVLRPLASAEFINRFTDAEYLALKQKYQADLAAGDVSGEKIWDIVLSAPSLDLNGANAQTLKADLVADSILTQARADEIFGSGPSGTRGALRFG